MTKRSRVSAPINFYVSGWGRRRGVPRIEVGFTPPRSKRLKVDGRPIARLTDLLGVLACVSFGPEDAELTRGAPQLRRRFIDYALAETNRASLEVLTQYRRVVQQRAAVLRDARGGDAEVERDLAVWDEELVRLGLDLTRRRAEAVAELAVETQRAFAQLGSGLRLEVRYAAHAVARSFEATAASQAIGDLLAAGEAETIFRGRLRQRRVAERARGQTLVGPHRDDLELGLEGRDLRLFGSQGQCRAVAVALKMAQAEFIGTRRGDRPIVVLDDVFAELDEARATALWSAVCERHQTFLAVPRRSDLQLGSGDAIFEVRAGVLSRQ